MNNDNDMEGLSQILAAEGRAIERLVVDSFEPVIRWKALSSRVLVVARTRVEGSWAAYIDAVPGKRHELELEPVLDFGAKLGEPIARLLFPEFNDTPYAR